MFALGGNGPARIDGHRRACVRVARPQVDPVRSRWVSRLRLFHDEAGNIGSQLIAMTLLQQEDCVHRSAEKAAPHQGKDALAQRVSVTHLLSAWNKASFSEQIGPVACPSCGCAGKSLPASPSCRRPIAPLLGGACFTAIIHKCRDFCQ
jgi:hypothetical protein